MSKRLPDGTVVPELFKVAQKSSVTPNFNAQFKNFALRAGHVIAAYSPDDSKNVSKKHWEYDVSVTYVDEFSQASAASIYYNCRVMRIFGGVGDSVSYTLRLPDGQGLGSMVFVLCDNGNSRYAYIVGSPEHPNQPPDPSFQHYLFRFNGVEFFVDREGGVVLSRGGPEERDGAKKDGPSGQTIAFSPNGSVLLKDSGGEAITLRDGQIEVQAKSEIYLDAPFVVLGSENLAPVLRATDSYVDSATELKDALKTFIGGVRELCTAIGADPLITAPKAPAAALLPVIVQLEQALEKQNKTLSTSDAISTVTSSE